MYHVEPKIHTFGLSSYNFPLFFYLVILCGWYTFFLQFCYNFICFPFQYRKEDVFNAAQSGAMITNIVSHEFNHLLKKLKEVSIIGQVDVLY